MRNQRGFSLIEVLVASTILLVVAVGILPLFASSIKSNQSGNDSTQVANFARERLERFIELPFNSTDMTIDAGSEKTFTEYFSLADRIWVAGAAPADDPALWTRTTVVRQYPVEALEDGQLDPASEALAAGSSPAIVHIKQVEVQVDSTREAGAFGPGKRITLRTLKAQ